MRRKLILASAVLFAAVGFTGCLVNPANMSWWLPASPTATTPYVGVFGDSITVETQWGVPFDKTAHILTDDLQAAGDASIVDASIGATTNDLGKLEPFTHDPDVIVIALGTNDAAGNYVPVDQYTANITGYLATSPAKCVALVNISTVAWDLPVTAPPYNAALQAIADASNGRIRVADWNSEVLAHPEYLFPGNPHTTAVGTVAYRSLIEQSIADCVTSTTTTTVPDTTTTVPETTTTTTVPDTTTTTVPPQG